MKMKTNKGKRKLRWLCGVGGVVALACIMQVSLPLSLGAGLPRLVGGAYKGYSWVFGAQQRNKLRCVEGSSVAGRSESCQMLSDVLWSNGATLQLTRHSAVLFFFLNEKVGYLNVDVRPANHSGDRWLRVRARRITDVQRQETHLTENLRYGVVAASGIASSKGDVCVKRVAVFDNYGRRIERSPPIVCTGSRTATESTAG
jgi:hypothetical protein